MNRDINDMGSIGEPCAFTCPAYHGALWALQEGYRCHVGHAYSAESLLASQSESVAEALFSGIRAMEEKATISRRIAARLHERSPGQGTVHAQVALEMDTYADILRRLLASKSTENTSADE